MDSRSTSGCCQQKAQLVSVPMNWHLKSGKCHKSVNNWRYKETSTCQRRKLPIGKGRDSTSVVLVFPPNDFYPVKFCALIITRSYSFPYLRGLQQESRNCAIVHSYRTPLSAMISWCEAVAVDYGSLPSAHDTKTKNQVRLSFSRAHKIPIEIIDLSVFLPFCMLPKTRRVTLYVTVSSWKDHAKMAKCCRGTYGPLLL